MSHPHPPAAAPDDPTLSIGISACLLGENVRANGGHSRDAFLVKTLGRWVTWTPVCPEVEMGMATPRPVIRLVGDAAAPRLLETKSGQDHTEGMETWAAERLEALALEDLDGYVFKKNSPSCGLFRVRVYSDQGMPARIGRGLFAMRLTERLPLLPVEEEGRLNDPRLRENFIERIFAHHRFRAFLSQDATPGGLVRFHTAQKMAVLAHSPEHYRTLGRLVAKAGTLPWDDLAQEYGRLYLEALSVVAKRGRHVNVLEHILGFLKDDMEADDKTELLDVIRDYAGGLVPLVVPLTLFGHHLRRHDVPDWVRVQTYLRPYPRELMLRNHV